MEDLRLRLVASFPDRYRIGDEIGRGGMATVFAAEDQKHGRTVAVKVLHPELVAAVGGERFLREIEIAARLQHPHIVPLYDSGEAGGLLYYLMPFIEGESLGARLERDGPRSLDEALRITLQVADALDYAHAAGVVHRDIKPDNVMLSGGHALVMDFGIATALRTAGAEDLTQTGMAVGTPTYMSPEQVDGADELDGRSDLYSLGCVLYEMLGGRPPYVGRSLIAILAQQAQGEYPRLAKLRPDVPGGVEAVIERALARDPRERYATTGELAAALREAPGAAATPTRRMAERSIAVLPFANMSADPENEYFSDGMAEEIINALTKLPTLKVAARTSSFTFKGGDVDLREVGEKLGVTTVLEGSVRKAGNKLRVMAQLIDVKNGFHLWAERYDRVMTDVFAVQDELAAAIVERLEVELTPVQKVVPLVRRGTDDQEAYHLYLRGRHFWERRDLQKALGCFEQAITRDPQYPLAHAGLADGFSMLAFFGYVPAPVARAKATESARRALAGDPSLPEAHIARGGVAGFFDYDAEATEEAFRRAISVDPRSAYAHTVAAHFYGVLGRVDDVKTHADRALELDVLSAHAARVSGFAYALAGDPGRGVELCARSLELEPGSAVGNFGVAWVHTLAGDYDVAADWMERSIEVMPAPLFLMLLGWTYGLAGRRDEAEGVISRLREGSQEPYCAWIEATLGDYDAAFRSLEALFQQRLPIGAYFALWPGWAELRADPRYAEVVTRAGLPHLVPSGV